MTGAVRRRVAATLVALLCLAITGCTATAAPNPSDRTIGLLLPESEVARYETSDRPTFESLAARRCPTCTLLYANAGGSAARQQEQAEAMLARGAKVLVVDAVDTVAAQSIVDSAKRSGAVVIAYDRFIEHPDVAAYVSFDSELIGRMQTAAVLAALPRDHRPRVLLVNGSSTDPSALAIREGVHSELAKFNVEVLGEFDAPAWSAARAQDWVTGQLTRFPGRIDGIIAANDALAGGAIASLKSAGISPMPPVSGEDAELSAIQRIIDGDQLMTVAKATDDQARTAAEVAVRLVRGEVIVAPTTIRGIDSFLLAPTLVDASNIQQVIIQGRVHSLAEICTPVYADACARLGLIAKETP
ncbi:MAG TPA: substrate-binding domain-containing protein [Candidatus Lumbricidophila sp.]|nr:substrate-binding domain-containing protein [Candidatus Lumbricidophila sp.]